MQDATADFFLPLFDGVERRERALEFSKGAFRARCTPPAGLDHTQAWKAPSHCDVPASNLPCALPTSNRR
jgi:hypothetical protein